MPRIFISYRRADSQTVTDRLYERLAREFGFTNVFRDIFSIHRGQDFKSAIEQELRRCKVVLVIIGRQWLTVKDQETGRPRLFEPDDVVRQEVKSALGNSRIRVIPVLVEDAQPPAAEQLPPDLRDLATRNMARVRNDPDFNNDVALLVSDIRGRRVLPVDPFRRGPKLGAIPILGVGFTLGLLLTVCIVCLLLGLLLSNLGDSLANPGGGAIVPNSLDNNPPSTRSARSTPTSSSAAADNAARFINTIGRDGVVGLEGSRQYICPQNRYSFPEEFVGIYTNAATYAAVNLYDARCSDASGSSLTCDFGLTNIYGQQGTYTVQFMLEGEQLCLFRPLN